MTNRAGQIAVFFDLQGTLGGDGLDDIRDFRFFPGAIPAVKLVNEAELLAVVVTNQSRISRGLFGREYFDRRIHELQAELRAHGAWLDGVFCCPHTAEEGCACRKTLPGLLRHDAAELGIDLSASYVVGDVGAWGMVMARAGGCRAVLVRTGLGEGSLGEFRHLWADLEPDYVPVDVLDAARWIVDGDLG